METNNPNKTGNAPVEHDISYQVMPRVDKKNLPIGEPLPHTGSSLSSDSGKKWFYLTGAIALIILLAVLLWMLTGKSNQNNGTQRLPKIWLSQYFGSETCADINACGDQADPDADGLSNYDEFRNGTNPKLNDTDADGLADSDEINIYKTDPALKYTDRRDVAVTNDYNDAVSIFNEYDPLTPGIKMTASRKQQIANDIQRFQLHEPTPTTFNNLKQKLQPANKTVTITIDKGFTPNIVTINKGDVVVWLGKDTGKHKIASDPHPQHTNLPGLVSSEFGANQTYSFKFENTGTFGYHDHLNPSYKGIIEVK